MEKGEIEEAKGEKGMGFAKSPYCIIAIQTAVHTIRQSHSHTARQPDSYTATQPHTATHSHPTRPYRFDVTPLVGL